MADGAIRFPEIRRLAKIGILIESVTTPNSIAAQNSPATIATGNDTIAITKIASLEMITTWAAEATWVKLKSASVSTDYPAKLVRGVLNSLSREVTTRFTESTTGPRIL